MLGCLLISARRNSSGVLAGRQRDFVDEALHVDAVLIGVDPAPRADRHVRVAHRVFDQQVRHRVAELRVAWLLVVALKLAHVPPADDVGRAQRRVDRLTRHAHVQPDQISVGVEAGGALAHRDRPVEVVRLIFLATPDQLDRRPRELLWRSRPPDRHSPAGRADRSRRQGQDCRLRTCRAAGRWIPHSAASEPSAFCVRDPDLGLVGADARRGSSSAPWWHAPETASNKPPRLSSRPFRWPSVRRRSRRSPLVIGGGRGRP